MKFEKIKAASNELRAVDTKPTAFAAIDKCMKTVENELPIKWKSRDERMTEQDFKARETTNTSQQQLSTKMFAEEECSTDQQVLYGVEKATQWSMLAESVTGLMAGWESGARSQT